MKANVTVLCWSSGVLLLVFNDRGDTGGLSDAFTSVNVYVPKSSAPLPNISGAAVSTLLKCS